MLISEDDLAQFKYNNNTIDFMRDKLRSEKLNKGLDPNKQEKAFGLYIIRQADVEVNIRKIYVGYSKNVIRRWSEEINAGFNEKKYSYEYALSRFIRKYGQNRESVKELLEFIIIAEFDIFEEVLDAEMYYIKLFKTNVSKFGKNMTDGGSGILGLLGEKNPNSKLTQREVTEITQDYTTGEYTCKSLADKYKIGRHIIKSIINNRTWKNENLNLDKIKQIKIDNKKKCEEKFSKLLKGNILATKLTQEEAIEIRTKYFTKKYTYESLAVEYKVHKRTIARVIKNKTYIDKED